METLIEIDSNILIMSLSLEKLDFRNTHSYDKLKIDLVKSTFCSKG